MLTVVISLVIGSLLTLLVQWFLAGKTRRWQIESDLRHVRLERYPGLPSAAAAVTVKQMLLNSAEAELEIAPSDEASQVAALTKNIDAQQAVHQARMELRAAESAIAMIAGERVKQVAKALSDWCHDIAEQDPAEMVSGVWDVLNPLLSECERAMRAEIMSESPSRFRRMAKPFSWPPEPHRSIPSDPPNGGEDADDELLDSAPAPEDAQNLR